MKTLTIGIFYVCFVFQTLHASPPDPLAGLNYHKAFDLTSVYDNPQNIKILRHLHCLENVALGNQSVSYTALDIEEDTLQQSQLNQFKKDCLAHLYYQRKKELIKPIVWDLTSLVFLVVGFGTGIYFLDIVKSPEGAVGAATAFIGLMPPAPSAFGHIKNLCMTHPHVLDYYEKDYALNKHLIPHTLWPFIEDTFSHVRQDPDPTHALKRLQFALKLKAFRRPWLNHSAPHIDSLSEHVQQKCELFFGIGNSYLQRSNYLCFLTELKCFLKLFIGGNINGPNPQPIYLKGRTGTGKSTFIHDLQSWICDLFPYVNVFEHDLHALEEDEENPGLLLTHLKRQCESNSAASILLINEPCWMNDQGLQSVLRRILIHYHRELNTYYFGDGEDSSGIHLILRPTLVFVLGEDDIPSYLDNCFFTMNWPIKLSFQDLRRGQSEFDLVKN
jgi:hypothetical protein